MTDKCHCGKPAVASLQGNPLCGGCMSGTVDFDDRHQRLHTKGRNRLERRRDQFKGNRPHSVPGDSS